MNHIKTNMRQYIKNQKVKLADFYEKTGLTRGILLKNGINEDTIRKFFSFFPDADANEIFKGEIAKNDDNFSKSNMVNESSEFYHLQVEETISAKNKTIEVLEDTVEILSGQVVGLQKDKEDLRKDKEIFREIVEKKLSNIA